MKRLLIEIVLRNIVLTLTYPCTDKTQDIHSNQFQWMTPDSAPLLITKIYKSNRLPSLFSII